MKDTCNYPDGTFIGIITDIQTVEKPYPSVTVTAALAINGKIAKHQKCFNKPFTNGREAFQNFCEEFDLFSDRTEHRNDYVLELDYAIGTSCTAVLSSDRGFESITPLGDTDLKIAFGLDDCYEKIRWFQPETYCTEKDMANLAPEIREQRLQLKRDLMLIKSVLSKGRTGDSGIIPKLPSFSAAAAASPLCRIYRKDPAEKRPLSSGRTDTILLRCHHRQRTHRTQGLLHQPHSLCRAWRLRALLCDAWAAL